MVFFASVPCQLIFISDIIEINSLYLAECKYKYGLLAVATFRFLVL